MRFLSVCSGIEAASVAWNPLGWKAAGFSEIEPFPRSVLAHHYPDVPNFGDMTKFEEWPDVAIDLLCGGTPCQSFSVAGLRKGLADPRGNLMLTFGAIAARFRPRWLVWENVPGVLSSSGGRDFGSFLGLLGELGYGFAYRVLDAQYFGLAQRRKRVFVVGCLGDWRRAAAVLFERSSLSGHPAPSRQARQGVAGSLGAGSERSGGRFGRREAAAGHLIPAPHADLSPAIKARDSKGVSSDGDGDGDGAILVPMAYVPEVAATMVARSSRGGGQTNSPGHQAEQQLVALGCDVFNAAMTGDVAATMGTRGSSTNASGPTVLAFSAKDHGADAGDIAPTLQAGAHSGSHANGGVMPAVAFDARQSDVIQYGQKTGPLDTDGSSIGIHAGMQVRRLTPLECERLQGFPDGYTAVAHRGKPAADGPRYKALGNSWAVPCVRWIGERIGMVEAV